MKVLMRPAFNTMTIPNNITVTSLKGMSLSKSNFEYELYKSKLCSIETQTIGPSATNRNLFNQVQFRGKAGSIAYVPSYEICKQYLNTTNIHGWEVGKVTKIEPGLERGLLGMLCDPQASTRSVNIEAKQREAGYVHLRVEYDTPCKQLRILAGTSISGRTPLDIAIHFEDGTTSQVPYITTTGQHAADTHNFEKGIVACELVQRERIVSSNVTLRYFAPLNTETPSARYSPSITNVYLNVTTTSNGYSGLDYNLLEMECTHDVQDTSKVFIPRPFFLWQASGSIPPLKIQADFILEGTKV